MIMIIFAFKEIDMSKECKICGKKPMVGNNVSHAHNVNKRRFNPNLQRVRAVLDGKVQRIEVCTSCIKAGKVIKTANSQSKVDIKAA